MQTVADKPKAVKPGIGAEAADVAMRAAVAYLRNHDLQADLGALAACLKVHVRAALPEAIADARAAIEAHMPSGIAAQTFAASMALAGIEAAKEVGTPVN